MKDAAPKTIYLADYTRFGWEVEEVHLTFTLDPEATRVKSRVAFRPAPDAPEQPFFLHGEALRLIRAAIDQQHVPLDAPINGAREIAFFPPVTGG